MIDAARAGDAAQRVRVLEVFRPYLIVIGMAKLDSRMQGRFGPSDAAQATIIKAHRQFDQFGGCAADSLRRWLDEIHSNVVHDARRRYLGTKKRGDGRDWTLADLKSQDGLERLAVSQAEAESPSKKYALEERQVVVARALLQLTRGQRQVLELKYLEQLSFVEVGARMGITSKAARMAAARGLKILKKILERAHDDESWQ